MATECLQQWEVFRSSCEVPHKKIGISRKIFIKVHSIRFHLQPSSGSLVYIRGQTDRRKNVRTEGKTDITKATGPMLSRDYVYARITDVKNLC